MTDCPSNYIPPNVELITFIKGPVEILPFGIDYSEELAAINDSIDTSYWVLPSETVDSFGNASIELSDSVTANYGETPSPQYSKGGTFIDVQNGITAIMISGGSCNTGYKVMNVMTTVGGKRYARLFILNVQNRS